MVDPRVTHLLLPADKHSRICILSRENFQYEVFELGFHFYDCFTIDILL